MYLPRQLISHLYAQLLRSHHPLSPPVLLLVSLDPDALCACRILTTLFKRDYIAHKIQPVAGYGDLTRAAEEMIRPSMRKNRTDGIEPGKLGDEASGSVVICIGLGGLVDLKEVLVGEDLDEDFGQGQLDGIEVWVFDSKRPWNLENIFGSVPTTTLALSERDPNARSIPHVNAKAAGQRSVRGIERGRVQKSYRSGRGGIIVIDDGDITEEMTEESEAYYALAEMPELNEQEDDDDEDDDGHEDNRTNVDGSADPNSRKRKHSAAQSFREYANEEDRENTSDLDDDIERPKRRRSNSGSSISQRTSSHDRQEHSASHSPPTSPIDQTSAKSLRLQLRKLRRKHELTLQRYLQLGLSYSEPVSSLMYSLASDLGREDNDLLWLTIVGVSSVDLSRHATTFGSSAFTNSREPFSNHHQAWRMTRSSRLHALLRDEVRRLNLPSGSTSRMGGYSSNNHSTTVSSPSDTSIRLTPDPRFVLLRHWSLYDSMLHSSYLASRLQLWNDAGVRRLHKLLAKMGVSLTQCRQSYTHMNVDLKRNLRQNLLTYAAVYGLDDLVPAGDEIGGGSAADQEGWGFVRSWGWKAQLSAADVGVVINAILQVGDSTTTSVSIEAGNNGSHICSSSVPSSLSSDIIHRQNRNSRDRNLEGGTRADQHEGAFPSATLPDRGASLLPRFFAAYDALAPAHPSRIVEAIPLAQYLLRAVQRTGGSLLAKNQIRHLRSFRMSLVKDGPDLPLFASSPAALVQLALWVGEALAVMGRKKGDQDSTGGQGHGSAMASPPLVLGALDEIRGTYILVGTGGGTDAGAMAAALAADHERQREKRQRIDEKETKRAVRAKAVGEKKERREEERKKRKKRKKKQSLKSSQEITNREKKDEILNQDNSEPEEGEEEDDDDHDDDVGTEDEEEEDASDSSSVSDSDSDCSSNEPSSKYNKSLGNGNHFPLAFTEVVEETKARVKIDSFDHCVVEVKKEDLAGFLEGLSLKSVVGRW